MEVFMKIMRYSVVFMLVVLFFASGVIAQDAQYVGASKCQMCHKSAKKGDQFGAWEAGPHSKAFATLATEESKKIAAEMGLGDPQKADECLECHVTAHSAPAAAKDKSYSMEEGVSCESCHGPGSLYRKASVMSARKYAADPAGTKAIWMEMGLIDPTEKVCITCHNEKSPTYKPFNFAESVKKIAHPNPNIKK